MEFVTITIPRVMADEVIQTLDREFSLHFDESVKEIYNAEIKQKDDPDYEDLDEFSKTYYKARLAKLFLNTPEFSWIKDLI
jgi:hypothetical protein